MDTQVEILSSEVQERSAAVTRIRTEMMSGEGPDVFICICRRMEDEPEPLFLFPMQLANREMFLCLDDYIPKAELMEWDALVGNIMEAGKTSQGQMLLPLAFTFPVAMVEESYYHESVDEEIAVHGTWEEQVTSSNSIYRSACGSNIFTGFAAMADYEKEALAFTEEELFHHAKQEFAVPQSTWDRLAFIGLFQSPDYGPKYFQLDQNEPPLKMIPKFNISGGITGRVTAYAAINKNTACPEEAFRVVDALLSKNVQMNSELYGLFFGMPTHSELGQESAPARSPMGTWHMTEENFAQYVSLREKINSVSLYSQLDLEMNSLSYKYYVSDKSDEALKAAVKETMGTMKQWLSEG